jgi:CubicO group peptidase (beta-lactamase class C family)
MMMLEKGAYSGKVLDLSQADAFLPVLLLIILPHNQRRLIRRFVLIVSFLCLAFGICPAQNRVQKIDSVLTKLNREEAFSGNVLISEKGKIIYEKSLGYANAENRKPLTENTIFLIGSVAKTFTAVALLKLREQGKLNLDDPVTKFLPELSYKNVTLRHLLTHTSGLLEYQSEEIIKEIAGKGVNNSELVKVFVRLNPKQEFEPGSKWEYSNTNYILLALVVEKVSRKSFPQFISENIFAPAGMTRSFVSLSNIPETIKKEMAAGYRFTNPLAIAPVNVDTLDGARRAYATKQNLYGAGNVYSTARDLLKFHQALQRGKILNKQSLSEMYAPTKLTTGADYKPFARTNYLSKDALGWFVADDRSGKIVYHPGGDIGYVSYFLRNITKDQAVIVLSNIELMRHYTPTGLMRILNDEPYKLDVKSLAGAMGKEYNQRGNQAMLKVFHQLKANDEYNFSEDEMNELGLRLLYDKKDVKAAIEVLRLNTEQFPKSFNVWDSLGEAYYNAGNLEEAVKNYEKSLRINPNNEGGKRMLEKLRAGKP